MRDKDQVAIFESYREDILNKFKKSLEGDKDPEMEKEPIENEPSDEEITDLGSDEDLSSDVEDSDIDDVSEIEPPKKKNVIIRSQEVPKIIDPQIREILRRMPDKIEDVDVLSTIKAAIKEVNEDLEDDAKIKDTPLAVYDKIMDAGIYSEEQVDADDIENSDLEVDVAQDIDDDYSDDDDISGEREFDLSKKTRREREDFRSGMRRDVERSKAEDYLRQMGVDFRDFSSGRDDI